MDLNTISNREEIEDFLQEKGVFYNGLRGEEHHAHMDSYMTCINWKKLEEAWNELKPKYTKEQWEDLIKHWKHFGYCSPNCTILALTFERWLAKG
jgi:hypothetical protein